MHEIYENLFRFNSDNNSLNADVNLDVYEGATSPLTDFPLLYKPDR